MQIFLSVARSGDKFIKRRASGNKSIKGVTSQDGLREIAHSGLKWTKNDACVGSSSFFVRSENHLARKWDGQNPKKNSKTAVFVVMHDACKLLSHGNGSWLTLMAHGNRAVCLCHSSESNRPTFFHSILNLIATYNCTIFWGNLRFEAKKKLEIHHQPK